MYLLNEAELKICGLQATDGVLVACSGGADSVALLLECVRLRKEGRLGRIVAAHLDHGIRGEEARRDAAFTEALCQRLEVPFVSEAVDVPTAARAQGLSVETAARELRYAFLERVRVEQGLSRIVTAHHADDQAETVLLHLLRGSGLNGLCGMRHRSGQLVRPLLGTSKQDILRYLSERGEAYCTDSTNASDKPMRNRVRHRLLPVLGAFRADIGKELADTALRLQEDADYLESVAEAEWQRVQNDRRAIADLKRPIRLRVLRRLLPYDSFEESDLFRLDALLLAQTGSCASLKQGYVAWTDAVRIWVERTEVPSYCIPVSIGEKVRLINGTLSVTEVDRCGPFSEGNVAYLDADAVKGALSVRTPRAGDRFVPFGMNGSKLLSDFFTDRKIGRFARSVPLLVDEEGILFVTGHTVAQRVSIKDNTKHILKIEFEEEMIDVGKGIHGTEH